MNTAETQNGARCYRVHGLLAPSVTSVIGWSIPPDFFVEAEYLAMRCTLGKLVHESTEYWDRGSLALAHSMLDQAHHGYLAAWVHFREQTGFKTLGIEQVTILEDLMCAGRRDRDGVFPQRDEMAVLDIKIGVPVPAAHGPQLAAYARPLEVARGMRPVGKYAVHLHEDGTYELKPYPDRRNWGAFQAMCSLAHWKLSHGLVRLADVPENEEFAW